MARRPHAATALLALGMALASCEEAPTRIVLLIDADAPLRPRLTAIHVSMQREGDARVVDGGHYPLATQGGAADGGGALALHDLRASPRDGLLVLQPRDPADARRVYVTVEGLVEAAQRVSHTTLTSFVRGQTLYLSVVLTASCVPVTCAAGTTCVEGRCEVLAARALPTEPPAANPDAAPPTDAASDLGPPTDTPPSDATPRDVAPDRADDGVRDDGGDDVPPMDAGEGGVDASAPLDGVDASADALQDLGASEPTAAPDGAGMDGAPEAGEDVRTDGAAPDLAGAVDASTADTDAALDAGAPVVVDLAAGTSHVCALRSDGRLRCWGGNGQGQLGDGRLGVDAIRAAVQPSLPDGAVTRVRAAGATTCALVERPAGDGGAARSVFCWGANASGQLGDGTTTDSAVPREVTGLPGDDAPADVAVGYGRACAVMSRGAVWCWGLDASDVVTPRGAPVRLLAESERVRELALSSTHACVIREGAGAPLVCMEFFRAPTPADIPVVPAGTTFDTLTAGDAYFCAVRREGRSILCWGANGDGQLGDGSRTTAAFNRPVEAAGPTEVSAVAAGGRHTCAAAGATGRVFCWGNNSRDGRDVLDPTVHREGDLLAVARPSVGFVTSPQAVMTDEGGGDRAFTDVTRLAAGRNFTCALRRDGSVWCWGAPVRGADGSGNGRDHSPWGVPVAGVTTARKVAVGTVHACVIDTSDRVSCWGESSTGQAGSGTQANIVPAPVGVSGARAYRSMEVWESGACAAAAGGVFCWGARERDAPATQPTLVTMRTPDLNDAALRASTELTRGRQPASFAYPGICLSEGGAVLTCWRSFNGNLPCPRETRDDPCPESRPSLGAIPGGVLLGFGASSTNVCVLRADGPAPGAPRSLVCSCPNGEGQLGYAGGAACDLGGDNVRFDTIRAGEALRDVAVGNGFVCVVTAEGVVECAGRNPNGELGTTAFTTSRASFAAVPAIQRWWLATPAGEAPREVDRVWASGDFACARLVPNRNPAAAELWCWGRNSLGALGQGHAREKAEPAPVLGDDGRPLTGVVQASLGATSCALLASGRVVCWGTNRGGQLGAGVSPIVPRPRRAVVVP